VRRIGIADEYPPIGPSQELRLALGLSAENIVAEARAVLEGGMGR
jgi:transketolase C-terminal domain/subunit